MTFFGDPIVINDPGSGFMCFIWGRYVLIGGGKVLRRI